MGNHKKKGILAKNKKNTKSSKQTLTSLAENETSESTITDSSDKDTSSADTFSTEDSSQSTSKSGCNLKSKVVIGDDHRVIEKYGCHEENDKNYQSLFGPVNKHECNANCLPKIPVKNIDEQLAYLKSFASPYSVPMMVFNFKRVVLLSNEKRAKNTSKLRLTYVTPCGKILFDLNHVKAYLTRTRSAANYHLKENFFTFSPHLQLQYATVEPYDYVEDITCGLEAVPVSLINCKVKGLARPVFRYVSATFFDRKTCKESNPKKWMSKFKSCCSCTDNCESNECECRKLTRESNCGQRGYQYGRLFSEHKFGIFECNSGCPCNASSCMNRITQMGMLCRVQVFSLFAFVGWGLRALHFIPQGAFITKYCGRIIDDSQLDPNNDAQVAYRFALDYASLNDDFGTDEKMNLPREKLFAGDNRHFSIDGSLEGNVGRFLNHSCDPNLFAQAVFTETHDMRYYEVAFFAMRDIFSFEELTFNYNYQVNSDPKRVLYCNCCSINCKVRIL